MDNEYELLDSGEGRKLERFGDVILSRPCAQALWDRERPELWSSAAASYERDAGWRARENAVLPTEWNVTINGIVLRLDLTPAGHVGVFPETRSLWDWITQALDVPTAEKPSILNLFAYSGGATLAAARAGCSLCHVDSSRSMVGRARENAALNQMGSAPIRWIVEDVRTFLGREIRRGRRYDAIMLDPPSFGRGRRGEQYRLERDLTATLAECSVLLSDEPRLVLLTSHTRGMTETHLASLLEQALESGDVATGEMRLTGASDVRPVTDGIWARWTPR